MEESKDLDLSLLVVSSDLVVDAHAFKPHQNEREEEEEDEWHDCHCEEDFSDLEDLHFLDLQGTDKSGRKLLRIIGKFFPAPVVDAERLKRFVAHKMSLAVPEGPFGIVYIHTGVKKEDNSPGISTLKYIYEDLPLDFKQRLQVVYFLHPGIRSWLVLGTLGRFMLSEGLYWKIKYISRLEFLWNDIKKRQIEIPDFVYEHDELLEYRPLMDYGIEADPFSLHAGPSVDYVFTRFDDR
eukprot:TRINITY_DN16646_c0_g1_i1.p1 TRINITY_DN16646_c0_g1~~TRINITY_DN16646_c0_g1_i1.p1  ORF type:complete len:238 (-),score=45.27 TRINITY_DN16646_c0_g1_i1:351-1064(-)